MKVSVLTLLPLLAFLGWTAAQDNILPACGKLNETLVYSEHMVAGLEEFPWFGRIYYNDIENGNVRLFRCVAVLVTKRHLLGPAHCLINIRAYRPNSVLLGDSNYGNSDQDSDCDATGCAPPPKEYAIADIAIHPNFDVLDRLNDVAVIQLERDVELSPYIQPICLPPASVFTADFLAEYITYAGFSTTAPNNQQKLKLKTVAHIRLRERCAEVVRRSISDTYLCASSNADFLFMSGSALMGVAIANSELKYYYLIGFLCFGPPGSKTNIELFTKISAHINWINSNIKRSRRKLN